MPVPLDPRKRHMGHDPTDPPRGNVPGVPGVKLPPLPKPVIIERALEPEPHGRPASTASIPPAPERQQAKRATRAGGLTAAALSLVGAALGIIGTLVQQRGEAKPPDTTTYATQTALTALEVKTSATVVCPADPPPKSVCARLKQLEDCQQLAAQALAAMNGGSLGPNWPKPGPSQFELQADGRYRTDDVYPCPAK